MKLVSFHLMPYRPLDLAEAAKHRSPWVVLPNRLYDPVKGAEEYARHIDALVYAEELGFDAIGVNEHHQTAYGLMPAPNLIASALIQRTKTIKIAILGRALPLVNNPIYIAEEFAMLDNLSKGRIIAGFVRGIGSEYHSSGTNPYFSHERFHEAHDLIIRAWTEPGPFAFDGDHFSLRYVNLWPRPYQSPHPPVWIPSQGSSETVAWAADPKRKYPFLGTFSSADLVARYHHTYRERARQYGYEAAPDQLGWACPIYVAETDARARGGGGAGGGDAVQRFPAPELRDADAARLHLNELHEEFHQHAQWTGQRQGHRRGSDRKRHSPDRQPPYGASGDRADARAHRLRHPRGTPPIRHPLGRSHAAQHGPLCRRGNAASEGIGASPAVAHRELGVLRLGCPPTHWVTSCGTPKFCLGHQFAAAASARFRTWASRTPARLS